MNLISDLGSELALAVLIEKRHSEKISSDDILPLIERLKNALQPVSRLEESEKSARMSVKTTNNPAF